MSFISKLFKNTPAEQEQPATGQQAPYTQEELDNLAKILTEVTSLPVDNAPITGGMDTSSLTCTCSCHVNYGPGRPSFVPDKDECDHCRVYGQ